MKKILGLAALVFSTTALLASCGGGGGSDDYKRRPDGLIDFNQYGDFDEKYYPSLDKVDSSLSGKIDVVLVFEGRASAYKEVAKEYSRIHGNKVSVVINDQFNSTTYKDKVQQELNAKTTDWDIIQGNLTGGLAAQGYCHDIRSLISKENAYMGNQRWQSVLDKNAFETPSSPGKTIYFNTENLQTAWFVNKVALNAAVEKGYDVKDDKGNVRNPETWGELLKLCKAMQDAGYTSPLGLALDKDSIQASQFTWLLRIYGDYYYRNQYDLVAADPTEGEDPYHVDVTSEDPENDTTNPFTLRETKLYNGLFDENGSETESGYKHVEYNGAKSERFKDFLKNLASLEPYINDANVTKSFSNLRTEFYNQDSKAAPQIFLDYAGEGLGYNEFVKEGKFDYDFFDYPTMEDVAKEGLITKNTLVRDVGGSGGYLSVVEHVNDAAQSKQWELSADFIKFFMTPYGQSIYYHQLNKDNLHPQALTLVKKNLVVVPDAWKKFFEDDEKIKFTGLSDNNRYISYLIRYFAQGTRTVNDSVGLYADLMTKGEKTIATFTDKWAKDIITDDGMNCDWYDFAQKNGYDQNCWKKPGGPLKPQF